MEAGGQVRSFLIADVRGYTQFTVEHGDEAAAALARTFAECANQTVDAHQGRVLELRGDEVLAVFTSARQAFRAAIALQESVGRSDPDMAIGVGLDAGEAVTVNEGYRGSALNLAARLCSLAAGGEVLASETIVRLAGRTPGVGCGERGLETLKGFHEPVRVFELRRDAGDVDGQAIHGSAGYGEQQLPVGGFLGAVPSSAIVSRQAEVERFSRILSEVEAGDGRLAMLAGEPGIGKTRLAQEVSLMARERHFLLATGRCYEPQEGVAFYPFLDALESVFDQAPASIRAETSRNWPQLTRLLPDRIQPRGVIVVSDDEQQRLFRGVTGFLQLVSEATPIALLLDDLHWADGSSLALLQHLARHCRTSRIFLLGTYRDVEVNPDHPLERALLDLSREQLLERVQLHRLPEEGTAEILRGVLGDAKVRPEIIDLVHNRTDGNAFFVEEIVRSLSEAAETSSLQGRHLAALAVLEVPESVRSVIAQRVSRLSEEAQETLTEASILGPAFDFDTLIELSERRERELEEALEEASKAGLVQETGRDGYSFNHALTQQALYERLSSRRRRRLHLAAGEAIERLQRKQSGTHALLAWHFLEADDPDKALHYSLAAGDESRTVYAHDESIRHYKNAVDLARELSQPRAEAEALEKLGRVHLNVGLYDGALAELEAAAGIYHELGDVAGEARAVGELGHLHRLLGTISTGIARVERLLERLNADDGHDGEMADLYITLETMYFACGRHEEGLKVAERGHALARAGGNEHQIAKATVSLGTELGQVGRHGEGRKVLEEGLPLAEKFAQIDPYTLTRVLNNLSNRLSQGGELETCETLILRAVQVQEETGNPWGTAFSLANLGDTYHDLGQWPDAEKALARACTLSREAGPTWWSPYPIVQLGHLRIGQKRLDDAAQLLEEAARLRPADDDPQVNYVLALAAARIQLLRQNYTGVSQLMADVPMGDYEIEATSLLARALALQGNFKEAEDRITRQLETALEEGSTRYVAELRAALGAVLIHARRFDEASRELELALQLCHQMKYRAFELIVLRDLTTLAGERGDSDEAAHYALLAESLWAECMGLTRE